jgi:hypothetical protein
MCFAKKQIANTKKIVPHSLLAKPPKQATIIQSQNSENALPNRTFNPNPTGNIWINGTMIIKGNATNEI